MRRSRNAAVGIALLALLSICSPGTATAPASVGAKQPTRLLQIVRGLVVAHSPGAIAFVRTPTRTRGAAAGFASLQPRVPMRPADRYRIASVTKTFVSTVVLQLAAEGKLSLEDTVEHRLPGIVPNESAITLRQLLNHTSGLFDYTEDQGWIDTIVADPSLRWTPLQLLHVAFTHPPYFAPGTHWAYSNTNYVVLGLVIEAATGERVADVLRERIFEPLKLRSTSFPDGPAVAEPFAHGYAALPDGNVLDLAPILDPSWAYAAGQIVSTAADVTTFFSALFRGRLLPSSLLAQMKNASAVSGNYSLGLRSTFTRCGRAFGHDGDFLGWRNVVWSTPNGRRVAVVMVNIDPARLAWSRLESAAVSAFCSG